MNQTHLLPVKAFRIANGASKVDYLIGKSYDHIQQSITSVQWHTKERGKVVYSMNKKHRFWFVDFHFRIEGDTAIVW